MGNPFLIYSSEINSCDIYFKVNIISDMGNLFRNGILRSILAIYFSKSTSYEIWKINSGNDVLRKILALYISKSLSYEIWAIDSGITFGNQFFR